MANKVQPESVGAPQQQSMGEGVIVANFDRHQALIVKQTMRGCCQECMGCEAKSEFKVAPLQWGNIDGYTVNAQAMSDANFMYALEDSGCCMRLCWRDGRPFVLKVNEFQEGKGLGNGIIH